MQAVCDAKCRIWDAVISWPGSVHDSRIFRHSGLKQQLETNRHGILLGDSGYPLLPYLLTPYRDPADATQKKFNRCLSRGRVRIEMCFGILKRRFACLNKTLRMPLERLSQVIMACIILNNKAIDFKAPLPPLEADVDVRLQPIEILQHDNPKVAAQQFRDRIALLLM